MSQEVKRQHYVPRTYLKNFAVEQAVDTFQIMAIPANDLQVAKMFPSNTEKVCVEKLLYTLPGNSVHEKMMLESFYSTELEKHYTKIYKLLIDPEKTILTQDERNLIIATVTTMFYRTTMWINKHNEFTKRTLTMLYETCKRAGKDYFLVEGEKVSIAGKSLEQLISEEKIESKPLKVLGQLEAAFKLLEHRKAKDGIMVMKLLDSDCEFITSDNPVIVRNIHGGRTLPFDTSNVMKLPIDNKHMLLLIPYADADTINTIVRYDVSGNICNIKSLTANSEQCSSAERFILGSESSLTNFLGKRITFEKPLTPEQVAIAKSFDDVINKAKDSGLI